MRHAMTLAAGLAVLALGQAQAQTMPAPGNAMPTAGVTTGALAELCAASADTNTAGVAYCRGFLIGVGQYHTEMTTGRGARTPIFCLPDPSPTIEAAQASFAAWARANPQLAGDKAVDGLMRWAAASFPCPTPSRSAAGTMRR